MRLESAGQVWTPQKSESVEHRSMRHNSSKKDTESQLDCSRQSAKNQKPNEQKMPTLKGQNTSKMYSGKLRSPLQRYEKLNPKLQMKDDPKLADRHLESFAHPIENSSKLNVNLKKDDQSNRINNTLSLQEDFDKIEKLSLINANARYELINANQQLIDFQMNRYIKHAKEQRKMKLGNQ